MAGSGAAAGAGERGAAAAPLHLCTETAPCRQHSHRAATRAPSSPISSAACTAVRYSREGKLWNEYIARYHYLGYTTLVGAQMRYAVVRIRSCRAGLSLGRAGRAAMRRDPSHGDRNARRDGPPHGTTESLPRRNRSAKPWSRPAGCYVRCTQTTDFHALRALTTSVRSDQHGLAERLHLDGGARKPPAPTGRVGGVVTEPLPPQTRACAIDALGSSPDRFAQERSP